jgi:hypothetical protein
MKCENSLLVMVPSPEVRLAPIAQRDIKYHIYISLHEELLEFCLVPSCQRMINQLTHKLWQMWSCAGYRRRMLSDGSQSILQIEVVEPIYAYSPDQTELKHFTAI